MAASLQFEEALKCSLCLELLRKPIFLCKIGHSMCGDCIKVNCLTICPECRSPLTKTRNYRMEALVESIPKQLKFPCYFVDKGCKYLLPRDEKDAHEAECKNRKFVCEGRKFAKWNCKWTGDFLELEDHFKKQHHSNMEFKCERDVKIKFDRDYYDIQIVNFFNGSQFFWYKHKVDVKAQMVYWLFQLIGTRKQARNYYYEFELSNGPVRKLKVTEICDNDVVSADEIFKGDKCIALTFDIVKNYMTGDKLPIKFRVMSIKKRNDLSHSSK